MPEERRAFQKPNKDLIREAVMAKQRAKKTIKTVEGRTEIAFDDQISVQWGESLVRFFDENDVGMDVLWRERDVDIEDSDYRFLMSGYEVYGLLSGYQESGLPRRTDQLISLSQFLSSKEALAGLAHLYEGGNFRYALPHED